MKQILVTAVSIMVAGCCAGTESLLKRTALESEVAGSGGPRKWTSLFDGKTLQGFTPCWETTTTGGMWSRLHEA